MYVIVNILGFTFSEVGAMDVFSRTMTQSYFSVLMWT